MYACDTSNICLVSGLCLDTVKSTVTGRKEGRKEMFYLTITQTGQDRVRDRVMVRVKDRVRVGMVFRVGVQ